MARQVDRQAQRVGEPVPPDHVSPPAGKSHLPHILVIVMVCLAIRIIPYYSMVFGPHGPAIVDPDACYHLRRAELIRAAFPSLPVFDPYMNFPHGAYIIWSPLYDEILAGLTGLLNVFTPDGSVPAPLPFLPPLLLTLACLVVYKMSLRLWPGKRWLATLAALFPALLPITVLYSNLGLLDHHAAEILAVALFMDGLLTSLGKMQEKKLPPSWIWTGVWLGLGLLVQHGLLLLEAVLVLCLVPFMAGKSRSGGLALAAIVNWIAFLVTVPWGLYCHLKGVPLAHTHFGLFQPLALLMVACLFSAAWLGLTAIPRLSGLWRKAALGTAMAATVVLGFVLFHQTLAGTTYLIRTWSGWQAQIAESHSLIRIAPGRAVAELSQYMSVAIFLLPVVWVVMFHRWRRLSHQEIGLLLSSMLFIVFGLFQLRFLTYAALLFGLLMVYLINHVRRWRDHIKAVAVCAVMVFAAGYVPCLSTLGKRDVIHDVYEQMQPVLQWLRQSAPSNAPFDKFRTSPQQGIISDWNLGHYIQFYGRWPVLADNFGEHATRLARLNDFFFSTDNESTYAFLDRNRVKYVLCQDLPSMYQSMILDKSLLAYVSHFDPASGNIVFSPQIYPTVLCRLVWRYGSAFIERESRLYYPPLDRLRIVAESPGRDETMSAPDMARIKLFEYVQGARVTITGLPSRATCALSAKVLTPHTRTFPYVQLKDADEHGDLSMVLPYPTAQDGRGFVSAYFIILGNEKRKLPQISEEMIRQGSTLDLAWDTLARETD